MIKAISFDLDHTLFDRYETLKLVQKEIRNHFDINSSLSDEEICKIMIDTDRFFVHKGWDVLQQQLINNTSLFVTKPGPNDYKDFVYHNFLKVAVPFTFTIPMLKKLKSQGYKLGLITNGIPDLQRKKIEMLKIGSFFDRIYVGGENELSKPHTEPFKIVAKDLNITPNEMAYVGDNPLNDVEASRKAGCVPIFVNTTKTWVLPEIEKPKYTVETVEEIPDLIEKINAAEI